MKKKPDSKKLIEELCNIDGIAGFEGPAAAVYKKHLDPFVELKTDYMGNISGELKGTKDHPRIMICAHLDELGLIVQSITDDGRINFLVHGSWWESLMLQQPVNIRTKKGIIPGIISSTSTFFIKGDALKRFALQETMFIDVGAKNRKEAMEDFGIKPGDPVCFDAPFKSMANPDVCRGKAFDDRLGIAAIIETVQNLKNKKHPNTVLPVATVQEEVGCRGAKAATTSVNPDIAIVLEGPPADDIPVKRHESQCILGNGVHIRRMEPGMICNGALYNFIANTAEELKIPHQPAVPHFGGTDGGIIHRENTGIPSIMFGIPVRYAHGHYGIFFMEDYLNTVKLLTAILLRLGPEVFEDIKNKPYG